MRGPRWTVRAAMVTLLWCAGPAVVVAQPPAPVVGGTFSHTVARGDTWQSIASRAGVDAALLAALNDATLKSTLKAGETLRVDNRHLVPAGLASGIVINIPQRMLFLMANGHAIAAYPVALGRPTWPTFVGPFTVIAAETDPVWDVPPSIQDELRRAGKKVLTRVGPGPSNPLGKYWFGLSEPNFGIHGTIAPRSIYHFETHGCIRLHPDDIADLWPRVAVGTPGEIIYQPVLIAVVDGVVLLEAHRDAYRRERAAAQEVVRAQAEVLGVSAQIDWDQSRAVLAARDGMPHIISH